MNINPIKTEQDYQSSLKRVELLWGSSKNTPEGDELDILCTLIEAYEEKHFPILPPDPIEAIKFRMEQMNLSKTDVAKYFGSKSRVTEVLNHKRTLSYKMAKSLYKGLKIPADSLLM